MKKPLQIAFPLVFCFFLLNSFLAFSNVEVNTEAESEPLTEFFEDFDSLPIGSIPVDWSKTVIATTDFADIGASSIGTPFSGSNHLRFVNSADAEAIMILATSEVTSFGSNWLTFWASMSSFAQQSQIITGYMTDAGDHQTFVATDTLLVAGNVYQKYFVEFPNLTDTDSYHIALRFYPGATYRTLYIDDISWETAPPAPVVNIMPEEADFGIVDLNASSTIDLEIQNVGPGTLVINQDDMTITGENASMFSLSHDIAYPIEISLGSTFTFQAEFTPTSPGLITAQLQINSNAVVSPYEYQLNGTGLGVLSHFFEDFSQAITPDLPGGWSSIVETSSGTITTMSTSSPLTPPNHVRMYNGNDLNAELILTGPKVTDFQTNWLRFNAKMSSNAHTEKVIVGYMPERNDHESFVAVDTIEVEGMSYDQRTVSFADVLTDSDEYHVAFRMLASSTYRYLFLDNILWENSPTDIVTLVDPSDYDFGLQQIETTSPPQVFTITNDGPLTYTIEPSDIEIAGADSGIFLLTNIEAATELTFGESLTIEVAFAPVSLGARSATLKVIDQEIPLNGEGADATITVVPHFEDFDQVSTPELPFGWNKIAENSTLSTANVTTITTSSPNSAPNHVNIFSNNNPEAQVMLISPPVENLSQKRIRFMARCNLASNIPDLIIGTMSDPHDASTFTAFQTIEATSELTNIYTQFVIQFNAGVENHQYIAFKHGGTPSATRSIFIDDFLLEQIPTGPVLAVDPQTIDFGKYQSGTSSLPEQLTVMNEGIGTLTLLPEDFIISGPASADFTLQTMAEPINLEPFEYAAINISFSPQSLGEKTAILSVQTAQISLNGEGIETTITEFPHFEDFDAVEAPALPLGWTSIVDNPGLATVSVQTQTNQTPNSAPNHAQLFSNNYADQNVMLISPPVQNLNSTTIQFYAKANILTNMPTLIVGTMSDPSDVETFVSRAVIEGPDELTSAHKLFTVSMADAGDHQHIAFRFGPTPSLTRSIFIDDITIEVVEPQPQLVIAPLYHNFGEIATGSISPAVEFSISNQGGGVLTVVPDDLQITGQDHQEFILNGLDSEVNLEDGQSAVISLAFAPETAGAKQAALDIQGVTANLEGQGFTQTFSVTFNIKDSESNVLNNAVITFDGVTNNQGDYVFSSIEQGTYSYSVAAPHFQTVSETSLLVDQDLILDIVMQPSLYDITFIVVDQNQNGVTDATITFAGIVNEPGNYVFNEIAYGNYDYTIEASHFETLTVASHQVETDETISAVIQANEYVITFNVEDNQGNPVSDAVITFDGSTNQAGDYVFGNVHHGTYLFSVSANHFETFSVNDFTVEHDQVVNVTLDPILYDVSFVIEDNDANALNNALITFGDITNQAGDYVFEGLPYGVYSYTIEASHYQTITVSNYLLQENSSITAVLDDIHYTVSFSITDYDGNVIENAVVTLGEQTNNAGDYVFQNVTHGIYNYIVVAEGYQTTQGNGLLIESDTTVDVQMPQTLYTVTFLVEDQDGASISNAVITLGEHTNDSGDYVFENIAAGIYDYTVASPGYQIFMGEELQITSDMTLSVTMQEQPQTYAVTFNVDMTEAAGFDPQAHEVYITGNFGGDLEWVVPGENSLLQLSQEDNSLIFSITLELEEGNYGYKYASDAFGQGWDGAEWAGEPNRLIDVFGSLEMNDIWGIHPDVVSVATPLESNLKLYPNPAVSIVNLSAENTMITKVRIFDLLGNVVYWSVANSSHFQFNVSDIKPGIYLLQIQTKSDISTHRLQIVR